MRSVNSIMTSHNKTMLSPKTKQYGCDCRNKESCPLQNIYLVPKVIVESTGTSNNDNEKRVYFCASDKTFKEQ